MVTDTQSNDLQEIQQHMEELTAQYEKEVNELRQSN